MTTHLSARLAWHDRGWDGRICDKPHLNAHCIVHKHIREGRDDTVERKFAGVELTDLEDWQPPCSRDTAAYSPRGFVIEHKDPLEHRRLPSVSEEIPPYSCCTAPYRWMREEFFQEICEAENLRIRGPEATINANSYNGWVRESDRQRDLLKCFWEKIEPNQSLVFYYVNHGNPLDESESRVIVGLGRIKNITEQLYFGKTPQYQEPLPVWSRCVTQDFPTQGVRIPYLEYLRKNLPTEELICRVPRNALLSFSYGGEHVSDDIAVAILERAIQCIEYVADNNQVVDRWIEKLDWLKDVLAEVWKERGLFPGAGSVLQYLGCSTGTAFQRSVLAPMASQGKNPWDYTLSILNGTQEPNHGPYRSGLEKARQRWSNLKDRRTLLSKLARFELTFQQILRIANPDQRAECGIESSTSELVTNPYIICESDLGSLDSDPIALETIDHGLRPEGNASLFPDSDDVAHDDRRRIRAVGIEVLNEAAKEGDTVLEFSDFLRRIRDRFPDKRACIPDQSVFLAEVDFYLEVLWTDLDSDVKLVALSHLHSLEQSAARTIKRRARKVNQAPEPPIDWRSALEDEFGVPNKERENRALHEKESALRQLFSQRLCVLTGGAGTGKTSVLRVFIEELEKKEGKIHYFCSPQLEKRAFVCRQRQRRMR